MVDALSEWLVERTWWRPRGSKIFLFEMFNEGLFVDKVLGSLSILSELFMLAVLRPYSFEFETSLSNDWRLRMELDTRTILNFGRC